MVRFTRASRCPICGGADSDPRGHEKRCSGFLSDDGGWARCTREEHAGGADLDDKCSPPAWIHRLRGDCRCGVSHGPDDRKEPSRETAHYVYEDEASAPVLRVCVVGHGKEKKVWQEHPEGDAWIKGGASRRLLYRWPELLASEGPVYVVEGERDVETMRLRGFVATCNLGGAAEKGDGKWRHVEPQCVDFLRGRQVIVVADKDPPGRLHASQIAASLPGATVVECARGKDVTEHVALGGRIGFGEDGLVPVATPTNGHTNGHTNGAGFVAPAATVAQLAQAERSTDFVPILPTERFFSGAITTPAIIPGIGFRNGPPFGLFGQAYVGKTIMALSMGLSVALGRDLWGRWPVKQGSWLHLDYEQGEHISVGRIRRLLRGFGVSDEELRDLLDRGVIRLSVYPSLLLTMPKADDHLRKSFEGITIVTCDSLRQMLGDMDENSSQVRPFIKKLSTASESSGAGVALLGHAGKTPLEGKRARKEIPRGSSAIIEEPQSYFTITKQKGDATALVSHEKTREEMGLLPDFNVRIEDVPTDDGNMHGALRVVATDPTQTTNTTTSTLQEAILRVRGGIEKSPGIAGIAVLAELLHIRRPTVGAAINQLLAEGTIVARHSPGPKGGQSIRFYLSEAAPLEGSP